MYAQNVWDAKVGVYDLFDLGRRNKPSIVL